MGQLGTMAKHCPTCGSVIYSRRAKLCGVCSAPLPVELRITGPTAEKIGRMVKEADANIRRMQQEQRDDPRHGGGSASGWI
jgi:hypothetical protein